MKWDGVKAREGRRGVLPQRKAKLWVACLTWEHVTFLVMEVTRYFIPQYMGDKFRYRHYKGQIMTDARSLLDSSVFL